MKVIPSIISREYVLGLSASDLREIFENAPENIIDQIVEFLPKPTESDFRKAHDYLNDGLYDSCGNIIGEKHPED